MAATVERTIQIDAFRSRLEVRGFKYRDDMHKFLNKDANATFWREHRGGLSPGRYVMAGGRWHNVKRLSALDLAHL